MSDQKYSQLYTSLLAFLEEHGREAIEGVAERGMSSDRAMEFIALLEANRVPLYGLEVWRSLPSGYDIDVMSIWCCGKDKHHQYNEARHGLQEAMPASEDLVAVQFG